MPLSLWGITVTLTYYLTLTSSVNVVNNACAATYTELLGGPNVKAVNAKDHVTTFWEFLN